MMKLSCWSGGSSNSGTSGRNVQVRRCRTELKELDEIKVLDSYLPEQMPEEEIMKIIADISSQVGASGPKDMGKVMGKTMAELKGRADGGKVKDLVLRHLSSL